ncbi:MAG: hypothetical protein CMN30_26090 [Sandaracinus sp.]|nr:hypothetical protein [Sandaracinus sp.]|tara:strand:+ start:1641 stop:2399 length:759 start_codon:yes stop_codon:yes gene_type:complete
MRRIHRIPRVEGLCPEQVVAPSESAVGAGLVDPFGRLVPLRERTVVGRDPAEADLAILQGSVSRRHALLERTADGWRVRDEGSTNGTWIDGRRVGAPTLIEAEQLLVFGDVGFIFVTDLRAAQQVSGSVAATERRPSSGVLRVVEPTRGGGGLVEFNGEQAQLGATQVALLMALAERRGEDRDVPDDVRGYIPAVELQVRLPWDTATPQGNHVKQLVRRTRRALERIDLEGAIESRQGFGYRLVVEATVERG